MSLFKTSFLVMSFSLVVMACGEGDHNINDNTTGPIETSTKLTYENVNARVFRPRCFRCHSGTATNGNGIKLDSYRNVLNRIDNVRFEVDHGNMPPDETLPASEREFVVNWIDAGAPQ